jgi:hypothetical protein
MASVAQTLMFGLALNGGSRIQQPQLGVPQLVLILHPSMRVTGEPVEASVDNT